MTGQPFRLLSGGAIDRAKPLTFTFDGKSYMGFAGDTLASALLANGVRLVGRSFKLHRPRGVMAAGAEETNAFVSVGEGAYLDANLRATQVELYDGLVARSLNSWPSVAFDCGGAIDRLWRFLPAGFYYKTFLWPHWHLFEGFIRRVAGLGRPAEVADPDRYEHAHIRCDVLVVGSGPAGLMAARTAAEAGAAVILAEQEPDFGGALQFERALIDDRTSADWLTDMTRRLAGHPSVTLLPRTTITGYYDGNSLVGLERVSDHLRPGSHDGKTRQRLWKIQAREVVLATGAIERPLVFPDNDRPGVMLLSAVRRYARQYAVLPGKRLAAFVNNDGAYGDIADLAAGGAEIACVIDSRAGVGADIRALMARKGIEIATGTIIRRVVGAKNVTAVEVCSLDGGGRRKIACDLLAMSGGWNPAVHLHSQSGGKLRYDEKLACFLPDRAAQASRSAGAANGRFALAECLADGLAAGRVAAEALGRTGATLDPPMTKPVDSPDFRIEPFWAVPDHLAAGRRQWVEFHNDVTTKDIALAARENFTAVEHLKRYTTLGMALDQGKTSNVNGLAVMGALTGRTPDAVGTTTFRPPYTPVTLSAIAGLRRGRLFQPIRHLPCHDSLLKLGARMEDYGGWLRPAVVAAADEPEEAAIRREVLAVRRTVGVTDYSPLGKIEVSGPDAARFLNLMVLTDVETIKVGRARYSLTLNENGTVIDDGIITRLGENHFLVGTTSGGAARIAASFEEWLQCEWPDMQVFVANVTTARGVLLVTGPKARTLLERLDSDIDFSAAAFPHMTLREGRIHHVPARVHRVSFSGEISYEIAVPAGFTDALFRRLMERGEDLGITPFGLESLLVMRLEKGFIHVGSDTDGTTLPDDIGFGAPARKKTIDYVGRRSLTRPDALRADRLQLVGLEPLDGRTMLPTGAHLLNAHVTAVPARTEGYVTSSAMSPTLGRPVALGLLKGGRGRLGETIKVFAAGNWQDARVADPCFHDPQGERING